MHKKYIVSVLITTILIQLYGCYSMRDISKDELAGLQDGGDLIVYTKDSTIYSFEESNYHFLNDSLFGKGYVKFNEERLWHYLASGGRNFVSRYYGFWFTGYCLSVWYMR